jgi:undecaprenyl diphosphate synthase
MPTQVHHVAIIMDGNGRWAKKRGLPRIVGHRQGVESVRAIVRACLDLGVDYLTLYTFSTENWQRPKREVDTLMKMLEEMLAKETPGLHKNNVKVKVIGRLDDVYPNARAVVNDAISLTKNNDKLILTFCISYGSRGEIVDAIKKIIMQDRKKHITLDTFDERTFAQFLYDPDLPDPDLLIRTGAENRERISNFLLWQIAYTEIYFTKTLWPDFRKKEFTSAVDAFTQRERLFGRVK